MLGVQFFRKQQSSEHFQPFEVYRELDHEITVKINSQNAFHTGSPLSGAAGVRRACFEKQGQAQGAQTHCFLYGGWRGRDAFPDQAG